jgi:hypothetical protein
LQTLVVSNRCLDLRETKYIRRPPWLKGPEQTFQQIPAEQLKTLDLQALSLENFFQETAFATRSRGRPPLGTRRFSGDDRDRTDNPRLAKPVLSQLSYIPIQCESRFRVFDHFRDPLNPRPLKSLKCWRSKSFKQFPPPEPTDRSLIPGSEWAYQDSNLGPRRYQRRALTN